LNSSIFSKNRRNILKASASLVLLPSTNLVANTGTKKPARYGISGYQAPELTVPTWIDGKGNPTTFSMEDQKGKFVFMEFWQYWCPGCHAHGFPTLKKISDEYKDNPHFTALSIQTVFEGSWVNTKEKMTDIQHKYGLYDIVMGHESGEDHPSGHPSTMANYRSGGTPWAVLIAPNGKVVFNDFRIDFDLLNNYLKKEIAKLS